MFGQVEIFLLGLATVVDTVLLLVIVERVNRPLVPLWLSLLARWGHGCCTQPASFMHCYWIAQRWPSTTGIDCSAA